MSIIDNVFQRFPRRRPDAAGNPSGLQAVGTLRNRALSLEILRGSVQNRRRLRVHSPFLSGADDSRPRERTMSDSIHDDHEASPDDSAIRSNTSIDPGVLKVYQTGPVTVVGFGGRDVPDEVCIAGYRDQLMALINDHHCQVLAFDLSGVKLIPSGMLGVLVTLRKLVPRIELYNASPDIQDVLRLTNLISQFELKDVAI